MEGIRRIEALIGQIEALADPETRSTVRELVSANPQLLKSGEQLTIPVAVAIPAEDQNGSRSKTYTVKSGDSLTSIAIKYATTVAAIASANNITNINNISVGQVLIIP